ncbi:MAG: magnesium/cobalt transporter CorA [Treponema sp.]|jgi:magnesium transporter|nr:magnesium/cobalt transporter CorA [Treponema sp.]
MRFSIIEYNSAGAWQRNIETIEELLPRTQSAAQSASSYDTQDDSQNAARNASDTQEVPLCGSGVTWINVDGLEDAAAINKLAEIYRIHPLTVEDIRDAGQRPKVEDFERYLFITFKAVNRSGGEENRLEQISIVLMEDTVITFQELPGDSFDPIRRRILGNAGKIRRSGADYLAYAIMDSIIDEYYLILDDLTGAIDEFEERALDETDESLMPDFQKVKQTLIRIKRVVSPLRESLMALMHLESPLINSELRPFLKDLHDNVMQAAETVENCRELLAGIMEINLATISTRMNKVMKVLTIISTIFIPLTFIAGVYGMNFRFMPELDWRYAYFVVWGVMAAIAIGMLIFFKRRKWL